MAEITLQLPVPLATALKPLFDVLPLSKAMPKLVVQNAVGSPYFALMERLLADPALVGRPALAAGLWLYVDELDRSHAISQRMGDATGSYLHAIMHRREGDFSNSLYWLARVGKHPVHDSMPGFKPVDFVRTIERTSGKATPELVETQRREWATLFSWCAAQGG